MVECLAGIIKQEEDGGEEHLLASFLVTDILLFIRLNYLTFLIFIIFTQNIKPINKCIFIHKTSKILN